MKLIRNGIVKTTFWITVFWWLVLTIYQTVVHGMIPAVALYHLKTTLSYTMAGLVLGFSYIAFELFGKRTRNIKDLEASELRGLKARLGKIASLKPESPRTKIASISGPKEVPPNFFNEWLNSIKAQYPQHHAMAVAIIEILEAHKHLPATHISGGHGDRTLYNHTMLVAWKCHEIAQTWKYRGLFANQGKQIIPPQNESFQINPNDPIYVIAGLAHDLGKIECYRWKDGVIVGCKDVHDSVSAQMVARTQEYWDMPDYERSCLNAAVSFYHKPTLLPMKPDGTMDDKSVAIMELLIKADNAASRLECGTDAVEVPEEDFTPVVQESDKEKLWNAFCKLINEYGRINSENEDTRIGQKNTDEQGRALIYLHEGSLREALGAEAKEDIYARYGDGQYKLTRNLLVVLSEKQCLYQTHNNIEYSDSRAVFITDFFTKKKDELKHLSQWKSTIIIYADRLFAGIASIPDNHIIPSISRPHFGSNSGKKANDVEIKSISSINPDDDEAFTIQAGTAPKKNKPNKQSTKTQDEYKAPDINATEPINNSHPEEKTQPTIDASGSIKIESDPLEKQDTPIAQKDQTYEAPKELDKAPQPKQHKNTLPKTITPKSKTGDDPSTQTLQPGWGANVQAYEPPSKPQTEHRFTKIIKHAIREGKIKTAQDEKGDTIMRLQAALDLTTESDREKLVAEIKTGSIKSLSIKKIETVDYEILILKK